MKPEFYLTAVIVLLALAASGATAQSWDSASTEGLTTVNWSLTGNTYTWTLTNNSGSQFDSQPAYDILVWSLQPFQAPLAVSWTAPDGWEWGGVGYQSFGLVDSSEKYITPPAVAPGESVVFTYTFAPDSPIANSHGPQPTEMAFISHVGAVQTEPTAGGGAIRWIPASDSHLGSGWFDAASTSQQASPQTPEPSGIIICLIGVAWLATHLHKNGKRLAKSRSF